MKLLQRMLGAAGAAAALAAATDAGAGSPLPADEAAITRILADQGAAWAKGDAEAFAAHVTPDVVFTNIVGMFSVGKAPFVAQHQRIFSTIYKGTTGGFHLQHLAFPQPDVAIVDTVGVLSGFKELPPGAQAVDGKLYTRLEQVMVKANGRWAVASFHNVTIQPPFVDDKVRALTASAAR